jgi:hypothetical protein
MKTFKQFVNSKRVYHVDIESHPLASRPTWSLTHSRDGSPVPHGIAAIEAATDGMTARLTTHEWTGLLTVAVTAFVHPRTTFTQSFQIEIQPIPDLGPKLEMAFTSHRDRPI